MKSIKAAIGRVLLARMPWHLLVLALVLTGVGAAFIRSSASASLAVRHLIFAGVGCAALLALSLFDYRHLRAFAVPLYAAGVAALVGLFFFGHAVRDARRWYSLGFFLVQPSEPMKYLLIVALADYFRLPRRLDRLRDLAPPLVMTVLPMMLIARQPDMGTAMVLLPVFFGMAFLGGVRVRNLAIVAAAGCGLMVAVWFAPGLLREYQRDRILSFVDPASDPTSNAAYNAEQAVLAISAGGLKGMGWGRGALNRLGRVPERHTDFIFPVVAEEWGFVRTAGVVCLYLLLIVALAHLARRTREPFGRLLVGGVLTVVAVQSFLHMAISLQLAPITGLTLPLMSYGGSSLVSTYAGLGLVASVRMHRSVVFTHGEAGG